MTDPTGPTGATGPDQELLDLARTIAREAGALVTRLRVEGVEVAATKSSPVDVVTAADRAAEELVRRRLREARPDDAVLGEEGDDVAGTTGVRWVVDPIDGTVNYLYGLPHWSVSLAAERDGVVVAGVVHCPPLEEEYAAVLGGGATCRDRRGERPLGERSGPPLGRSLVGTGFSYEEHRRAEQAAAVARMLPRVRDVRRLGSCALDLCGVATGTLDAYVEAGPQLWDHAAGALVARESGVRVEVWATTAGRDLVVAAPQDAFEDFAGLVEGCGFAHEAPEDRPAR
ncbi:MAG: suhB 2 [Marmoricola sp.]|nr:suhB 2 [Marmoricola sp.]